MMLLMFVQSELIDFFLPAKTSKIHSLREEKNSSPDVNSHTASLFDRCIISKSIEFSVLRLFTMSQAWETGCRFGFDSRFDHQTKAEQAEFLSSSSIELSLRRAKKFALIIFETLDKSSLRQYFIAKRSKFVLIDFRALTWRRP
jgi:hypothetical protein